MDTRNYNEPQDCGLGSCDCREDNTCGCSFPNNISDYTCKCDEDETNDVNNNCGCLSSESINIKTKDTHIQKEKVCFCTPQECDCTIERNETDNSSKR